jgi:hypothetical protein
MQRLIEQDEDLHLIKVLSNVYPVRPTLKETRHLQAHICMNHGMQLSEAAGQVLKANSRANGEFCASMRPRHGLGPAIGAESVCDQDGRLEALALRVDKGTRLVLLDSRG